MEILKDLYSDLTARDEDLRTSAWFVIWTLVLVSGLFIFMLITDPLIGSIILGLCIVFMVVPRILSRIFKPK